MLSEKQGADSARRGSACAKARGEKLAQEPRGPSSCSVPGSAPGRGGRAEPAGASLWAPGGGAVLGWRSGGGCRKPGALGCGGGGDWCCDRSAGPAPFGNPPPSGPPPPRPRNRPRLRPRPAPGARSKLSDMLLSLQPGPPPPPPPPPQFRLGHAGGAAGRLSPPRLTQASWRRPALPARSSAPRAPPTRRSTAPASPAPFGCRTLSLKSRSPRPPAARWGRGGSQRPPAARRPRARPPSRPLAFADGWRASPGFAPPLGRAASGPAGGSADGRVRGSGLSGVGLRDRRGRGATLTGPLRPPRWSLRRKVRD
jgi:hypothetical protein